MVEEICDQKKRLGLVCACCGKTLLSMANGNGSMARSKVTHTIKYFPAVIKLLPASEHCLESSDRKMFVPFPLQRAAKNKANKLQLFTVAFLELSIYIIFFFKQHTIDPEYSSSS